MRDAVRRDFASPRERLSRATLWILLAGLLAYVAFLGARDLWYPDEPDLAEVTRSMLDSGDWIVPRQNGAPWVDYPPMLYWTGALSAKLLGGPHAFALRLPSALAAIGLALALYAAGRRAYGEIAGVAAALAWLTFEQVAMQAPSFRPDVLFACFVSGGLLLYARRRASVRGRIGAFALFGLAVLTKGPLGLLLPGLVLVVWHALRREARAVLALAPLALVAVAVAAPWYVACGHRMGMDTLLAELHAQNLRRFSDDLRGHGRPAWYYLEHVWLDLAIWSPLLPVAGAWAFSSGAFRRPEVGLWLTWFAAMFVFFSLAVTKRELYLLPAYPAAALLLGAWFQQLLAPRERVADAAPTPNRRPARVFAMTVVVGLLVLGLAVLAGAIWLPSLASRLALDELSADVLPALRLPAAAIGLLLLGSGLWVERARRRGDLGATYLRLAAFQIPVIACIYGAVLPAMNPAKTYAPAGRWLASELAGEKRLGLAYPSLGHHKMGAFGYYTGATVELLDDAEAIERFWAEHPNSLVLVHEPDAEGLFADREPSWRDLVLRELVAGRRRYLALRSPAGG